MSPSLAAQPPRPEFDGVVPPPKPPTSRSSSTSIVIPAGDRLRVSLTTSDAPHEAPTLSTHVDSAGNVLSVLFGPATPSYLYLETFSAGWV